ncbi:MBL fold metallo-hydrolase [Nannocystis bainbridge]|uniref:MBL fold metallo-hydrolase n=1 Tax=Nannocystis bainbridge TaxID=2995303 RepID=A0ABT5EE71_9BACT|nr:MBL fold metallo-hydrolase [Nannocystis bainbridge]MDC0723748.1 MBL fold metallo-hydrolase [Nannocystis bainbridge]
MQRRRPSPALLALFVAGCGGASTEQPTQTFRACDGAPTFVEPNPAYAWTPNAIRLVSEELAPGVFAIYDRDAAEHGPAGIPLATSGGFVIGDDGVLMVESMINRQLFCQAVALVQAETDTPIRYVVNTSSHGDHTFGNTFLPDDVQVVQHTKTADDIAAHFDADVAFMEANFGEDQGIEEIEPVSADVRVDDGGWSVDLGGVTVEARHYGFAQTHGDLFVYVPDSKVMWTGNAFVTEEPGIPWLLAGNGAAAEVTLAAVRDSLPADAIVVPGHGRPLTPAAMNFSIDYLRAMIGGVETAVADGLDLEATVAAVALPDYQGYALWDWIHKQVNVPGTYAELNP